MPNVFQASTGYRDPAKAMTLKALEARAKAAQEATATSMQPTVVADPMQGWAGVLGTLGSQMQEGRADRAVAEGRDRLAQLQAGITDYQNIDPQTLAQIGALDPEQQRFLQERMLEIQSREDTQKFTAGESQLERDQRLALQNQQDALTRSESALSRGHTGALQEDSQAHQTETASKLAETQGIQAQQEALLDTDEGKLTLQLEKGLIDQPTYDARLAEIKAKRTADLAVTQRTANDPYTTQGDISADLKSGAYKGFTKPAQQVADEALAAESIKGTPTPAVSHYEKAGAEEAATRHGEIMKSATNAAGFKANIDQIQRLGASVGTGKFTPMLTSAGGWLEAMGIDASSIANVGEGEAYQSIVDKLAPNMRAPGSGSSSDTDVRMFLSSLPSLSKTPEGNAIIIETFQALEVAKMKAAGIIAEGQKNGLPWYEIDKQINALGDPYEAFRKSTGNKKAATEAPTTNPDDALLGKTY